MNPLVPELGAIVVARERERERGRERERERARLAGGNLYTYHNVEHLQYELTRGRRNNACSRTGIINILTAVPS